MNQKTEQTQSQDVKHPTEQEALEGKQLTLEDLALVSGGRILLEDNKGNRVEVG
ncbi:hypothetical protein CYFUS_004992 [Cystobacter fuscus]|uniref:Uncharacterized protein n=1 Tax=Cystobacter fuscus TaxID=43 RepID=A0A250J7M2_9BACT|nr:hypothetical protein [Cystobacter fuscus]ATB39548.1 hypothetical protein CYFUS_004992 [Cystobacter fuscus]